MNSHTVVLRSSCEYFLHFFISYMCIQYKVELSWPSLTISKTLKIWMNSYFPFPSHNLHWIQKWWLIIGDKIPNVWILSNRIGNCRIIHKWTNDAKNRCFFVGPRYIWGPIYGSQFLFVYLVKILLVLLLWVSSLIAHVEDEAG